MISHWPCLKIMKRFKVAHLLTRWELLCTTCSLDAPATYTLFCFCRNYLLYNKAIIVMYPRWIFWKFTDVPPISRYFLIWIQNILFLSLFFVWCTSLGRTDSVSQVATVFESENQDNQSVIWSKELLYAHYDAEKTPLSIAQLLAEFNYASFIISLSAFIRDVNISFWFWF